MKSPQVDLVHVLLVGEVQSLTRIKVNAFLANQVGTQMGMECAYVVLLERYRLDMELLNASRALVAILPIATKQTVSHAQEERTHQEESVSYAQ